MSGYVLLLEIKETRLLCRHAKDKMHGKNAFSYWRQSKDGINIDHAFSTSVPLCSCELCVYSSL
jgi:hypothetical protein